MVYSLNRYNNHKEDCFLLFLLDNGSVGIYKPENNSWCCHFFDKIPIKRMWKNCGGDAHGIIFQFDQFTGKLLFLTNGQLRKFKLDGTMPYVSLRRNP